MDLQTQIAHNPVTELDEQFAELERQYKLERNKPLPSRNHAKVQSYLTFELGLSYDKVYDILSELTIDFPVKMAVPDISIYPKMATNWENDVIAMKELPLLAIEILSHNQPFDDILDKIRNIYFPAGLKSVWVVLPPAQSIMIFRPSGKPLTFTSGIMRDEASGFEVDLDKIF